MVDFFQLRGAGLTYRNAQVRLKVWVYSKSLLIGAVCGRVDQLSLFLPINSSSAGQLSKDRNIVNNKEGEQIY